MFGRLGAADFGVAPLSNHHLKATTKPAKAMEADRKDVPGRATVARRPRLTLVEVSGNVAFGPNVHHPLWGLSPAQREEERIRDFAQVLAAIAKRLDAAAITESQETGELRVAGQGRVSSQQQPTGRKSLRVPPTATKARHGRSAQPR